MFCGGGDCAMRVVGRGAQGVMVFKKKEGRLATTNLSTLKI